MKILLVQPPKAQRSLLGDEYFMFEPLALEYLAAAVRSDHDVRMLDMRIDPDLESTVEQFQPDIVGVTAYTVHVNPALDICRRVKSASPAIRTVIGGHHATVRPQDFCRPQVDLVVAGEGVSPFRELVRRYEKQRPPDDVPGVFQVRLAELIGSPAAALADLGCIPMPERSISTPYRHRYFSEWMKPLATIRTSKGCPFRCTFCSLWRLTEGRYLKREPESIVAELRTIDEPNVFFADDESMINVAGLDRLADLIAQERVHKRYFCYGRSDTIVKHPELLEKWRDIGLSRVFVGVEAFRDQDLVSINKKSSVATNEQALRILDRLGIEAYANFMVRPEFDREDFRAFRSYCRGLPLSFAGFSVLTPLPGTQLFEEKEAELITRDWDYFDFVHTVLPTRLPLVDFYREYADLLEHATTPMRSLGFLRKFPLREIPGVLKRGYHLLGKIREAHRDHEAPPAACEAARAQCQGT